MTIEFVLLGASLCVAILFAQKQGWPLLWRATTSALILAIGIAAAICISQSRGTFLGPNVWYFASPVREIIYFVLMIFGMSVRYLSAAIEERRDRIRVAQNPADESRVSIRFDRWEFLYPMLFSVVTFGGLLSQVGDSLTMTNIILSFQTGFFWQTILRKELSSGAAA